MIPHEYQVETVSTEHAPLGQRLDLWSETVNAFQCALGHDYPRPERFAATATRQRNARFQLVTWANSGPQTIRRSRRQIRTDPNEHYRLMLPTRSSVAVAIGDVDTTLTPGAGILCVPDTPCDVRLGTGSEGVIVTIPRGEVDDRINRPDPVTRRVPLAHGLGRLLVTMLTTMVAERDALSAAAFDTTCTQVTDLACMLVLGDDSAPRHGLADDIRGYVRRHATDPDLSGARIANDLGWSLRQIQSVLRQAGSTPSELIRDERLRLARARLGNSSYRRHTVTAIAHASGFHSVDTFTKAFRQRYRTTPTEYRAAALGHLD